MEYTIANFTDRLRALMYARFPYENDAINLQKHKKRPKHIRDIAFMENQVFFSQDQAIFEIGNETSEREYPYYHILEQAPAIRKRGRGTTKTKGSQAKVENVGHRDYERVEWNGKTFTKEYSRNVRGSRNRLGKVSHWATDYGGNRYFVNREANAYENVHYKYIEKMLNNGILDTLASDFNMRRARTIDTGLAEEYFSQDDADFGNILDILGSHN